MLTRSEVLYLVATSSPFLLPLLAQRGRDFYRRGWRFVRRSWVTTGDLARQGAEHHRQTQTRLDSQDEALAVLRHEVMPNNGGSLRDAVDRIAIEGRHREAMMRGHFSLQNEGQFEADANGLLTWANETLLRWTGQPLHVLRGRGFLSVIAQDEQFEFRRDFETAMAEGREFRARANMRFITPPTDSDGGRVKHFSADWRVQPIRDPKDENVVIGYSGNVRRRSLTGDQPALRAVSNGPRVDTGD